MNKDFIIKNGVLERYIGNDTYVVIPEEVKRIRYKAFNDCSKIESIIIPEGVTSIGNMAFYDCCSLESIIIPDGVTIIEHRMFYNCHSLKSIIIPEGVTFIGDRAFSNCSNLKDIILPEKYTITKEPIKEILENSIIINRNSKRGLCAIIEEQTIKVCDFFLGLYFLPLFKKEIAIEKFNGTKKFNDVDTPYWWDINNRTDRENFLKYLLENI